MADTSPELPEARKDHFLQLMFFQPSRREIDEIPRPQDEPIADLHAPLHALVARPGVHYALPAGRTPPAVRIDSPATDVMTDLRAVTPVIISPHASLDDANRVMIDKRVRALFVVGETTRQVEGLITASDVLGERPLQVAGQRTLGRGDLAVRDIMTPAEKLEVLDLHDVNRARVGNILATLQRSGRQHALAVEVAGAAGTVTVCGIFSLTQLARQLGITPASTHDIAQTFAEIESAIAG